VANPTDILLFYRKPGGMRAKAPTSSAATTATTLLNPIFPVDIQQLSVESLMREQLQVSKESGRAISVLPQDRLQTALKRFTDSGDAQAIREAAELGFAAIYVSEANGGIGLGRLEAALIMEAMAYGCPSTSAFISIHNMASWMIDCFGSGRVKQKYLPALVPMQRGMAGDRVVGRGMDFSGALLGAEGEGIHNDVAAVAGGDVGRQPPGRRGIGFEREHAALRPR
jgi:alkylation response protein AidB-like acyl-CoA dehydrogenase